jgi:hypothetical protein
MLKERRLASQIHKIRKILIPAIIATSLLCPIGYIFGQAAMENRGNGEITCLSPGGITHEAKQADLAEHLLTVSIRKPELCLDLEPVFPLTRR